MKNQLIGSQQLRHLVASLNALSITTAQMNFNNQAETRLEQEENPQIRINSVH